MKNYQFYWVEATQQSKFIYTYARFQILTQIEIDVLI